MGRFPVLVSVLLLASAASPAFASCDEGGGFLGGLFGPVSEAADWVDDRVDGARSGISDAHDRAKEGAEAFIVQTSDDLFPWLRKPGPGKPATIAPCNGRSGGLKVMSYNIRSTRETSIDQIARDINGSAPDFVALQEVDVNGMRTARKDQPKELAKRTGLPYSSFGLARERGFLAGNYGNAILSKFPILQVRTWKLPSLDEQRVMICATVAAPGGETTACSVHLGLNGPERRAQVAEIEKIIDGFPTDRVVLMGDFNETSEKPAMRFLKNAGWTDAWKVSGSGQPNTSTPKNPTKRIDFILTRDGSGLDPQCTHVPSVSGSDHLPVVSTVY